MAESAPTAAVQCPRCPSDTADFELIKNEDGQVQTTVYQCVVCAIAWDTAGMIDPPQEFRPFGEDGIS